jgi:hypothetical protein
MHIGKLLTVTALIMDLNDTHPPSYLCILLIKSFVRAEIPAYKSGHQYSTKPRNTHEGFSPLLRRPLSGRQIHSPEEHYKGNCNTIAIWATAVAREVCTIQEPSDKIRLYL